ncbi:MAG: ABC transporter permease [Sphingobacteriaceae bacterium]|nr:ABC transporter permease [Sphingobacteriaceae bacterium]
MNFSFYIAKRYLFAKKSTNAINIISAISAIGIFVGSAALVIILSVFNGFEEMALKMFNTFTPELMLTPKIGKTFDPNTSYFKALASNSNVLSYSEVLSEKVVLKYNDRQSVAVIKGVSDGFLNNNRLDSVTVEGNFVLNNDAGANVVIGVALQDYLRVNTSDPFTLLQFFSPNKSSNFNDVNPANHFTIMSAPVSGVYEVQQELGNVAIAPLYFARELLNEETKVSAIELNFKPGTDVDVLQSQIKNEIGNAFYVRNRLEQNESLYRVLTSEKRMIYFILTFVLVIAIFNIIGSLTMLVIEKEKDIMILNSLGATKSVIQRVFLLEGMMITVFGCLLGLFFGFLFCVLQQNFGFIKIGEDAANTSYPIAMQGFDFVLVFFTVSVFSFLAAFLAAKLSVKNLKTSL